MTARYALTTFVVALASGASHLVIVGGHRDSSHPAVTGTPASFWSASPLAVPAIDPKLAGYLAAYPDGPQL